MKKTFVERIKSIGSGLDAAMNYLSEDLDAICDDTMREYAESALHSVRNPLFTHPIFIKTFLSISIHSRTSPLMLGGNSLILKTAASVTLLCVNGQKNSLICMPIPIGRAVTIGF